MTKAGAGKTGTAAVYTTAGSFTNTMRSVQLRAPWILHPAESPNDESPIAYN